MNLNKEQYDVINSMYNQRIMIVEAPPGTGKTFTAVKLATKFINDQLIENVNSISKVLILTFSKNAKAQIIKQKYKLKEDNTNKYIEITNYHSFYKKYIFAYSKYLGLGKELKLVSQTTRKKQIISILTELQIKSIKESQIAWAMDLLDGNYMPSNKSKRKEVEKIYSLKEDIIEKIIELNKSGYIYFSDFAYYMRLLLIKSPKLLKVIKNKYKLIILDEYQDSSDIQEDIVKVLIGNDNRGVFFADSNQMIYEWRGARGNRVERIKEYYTDEIKKLSLNEVYRYKDKSDIEQLVKCILSGKYNSEIRKNSKNISYRDIKVDEKMNWYNPMIKNRYFSKMKYELLKLLKENKSHSIGILTRENELLLYLKKSLKGEFNIELNLISNNDNEHVIIEYIGRYIEESNFDKENNTKLLINILDAISEEKKFGSLNLNKKEEYNYNSIKRARVEIIRKMSIASEEIYNIASLRTVALDYIEYIYESGTSINKEMYCLIKKILSTKNISAKTIDSIFTQYQHMKSFVDLKGRYILNVHQSKGREFDTVIILDSKRISQEKNLFYVAASRAKQKIIMVDWI